MLQQGETLHQVICNSELTQIYTFYSSQTLPQEGGRKARARYRKESKRRMNEQRNQMKNRKKNTKESCTSIYNSRSLLHAKHWVISIFPDSWHELKPPQEQFGDGLTTLIHFCRANLTKHKNKHTRCPHPFMATLSSKLKWHLYSPSDKVHYISEVKVGELHSLAHGSCPTFAVTDFSFNHRYLLSLTPIKPWTDIQKQHDTISYKYHHISCSKHPVTP